MAPVQVSPEATDLEAEEVRTLRLDAIRVDQTLQARVRLDYLTIQEYGELYQEEVTRLPPLDVFWILGEPVLADGFHRYEAARKVGIEALPCRVFVGSHREAYLHAVQQNAAQTGLPYKAGDY